MKIVSPSELRTIVNEKGLKSITAMFDQANYLWLDYPLRRNMHAVLSLKTKSNECYAVEGCTTGYNGIGPEKTKTVLTAIGISEKQAKDLSLKDSFELTIDGGLNEYKLDKLPFSSRSMGEIDLPYSFIPDLMDKTLYIVDPVETGFVPLMKTVQRLTSIESVTFDFTKHEQTELLPWVPVEYARRTEVFSSAICDIVGEPFKIRCYLGEKSPKSIANVLSVLITEAPVYADLGYPYHADKNFLIRTMDRLVDRNSQKKIKLKYDIAKRRWRTE